MTDYNNKLDELKTKISIQLELYFAMYKVQLKNRELVKETMRMSENCALTGIMYKYVAKKFEEIQLQLGLPDCVRFIRFDFSQN